MFRVLFGTDGSRAALKAAAWSAHFLRHHPQTMVSVVYVRPSPSVSIGPVAVQHGAATELDQQIDRAEQELLERSAAPFLDVGIAVAQRVETGQPGKRLCKIAADEGMDLVIIASRGHTELKALIVGSVSDTVVHGSPCPVLVVR